MSRTTDPQDPRLGHGMTANAVLRREWRARIRIMRECSVEDCNNRHNSHGYCQAHGLRFFRYGDPLGNFQRVPLPEFCSVMDCEKPRARANGLCQMHNQRLTVHGDVNHVPFSTMNPGAPRNAVGLRICSVPSCERKHKGHGYCGMHLNRWRKGISLDSPGKEPAKHRYRYLTRPGHPLAMKNGRVAEHRMVLFDTTGGARMPCFWCGRPLDWFASRFDPGAMVVDHRDHNRRNNDPTNLLPSCTSCNCGRIKGFAAHRVPVYSLGPPDGSEAGNRVGT